MTKLHNGVTLGAGYFAALLSLGEYWQARQDLVPLMQDATSEFDFGPRTKAPPPMGETFSWGVFQDAELVGFSHARQLDEHTIRLEEACLLPEHQGFGLYSRLLPMMLERFRMSGYKTVQAHHRLTNNRVLIPELRSGFFIQGLSLYEGGVNVQLTAGFDETYREVLRVRSGEIQPSTKVAPLIGWPSELQAVPLQPRVRLAMPPSDDPQPIELRGGYWAWRVPFKIYQLMYQKLEPLVFKTATYEWSRDVPSRYENNRAFCWLIEQRGEVVGWHAGREIDKRTVQMSSTGFIPQHRGRGLYTRLLPRLMDMYQAEGYTLVNSQQHPTNTAVIVPKLREGFRIQGLELGRHGAKLIMVKTFDPVYRQVMEIRSGMQLPSGDAARRMGLKPYKD